MFASANWFFQNKRRPLELLTLAAGKNNNRYWLAYLNYWFWLLPIAHCVHSCACMEDTGNAPLARTQRSKAAASLPAFLPPEPSHVTQPGRRCGYRTWQNMDRMTPNPTSWRCAWHQYQKTQVKSSCSSSHSNTFPQVQHRLPFKHLFQLATSSHSLHQQQKATCK